MVTATDGMGTNRFGQFDLMHEPGREIGLVCY
jgi:hypothetical protein